MPVMPAELINIKDPLTNIGGRAQVINEILKDAAQSVNTGKRPEKILQLMETQRDIYRARIAMQALKEDKYSKQHERLFIEDIFTSVTNKNGMIDFKKLRNIFKIEMLLQVVK